jgi:hypothetical protein
VRTLYPNFGAEEADVPPVANGPRVFVHLREAWSQALLPSRLGAFVDDDAFVAWLNTPGALHAAQAAGRPLWGADPGVVDVVHDKGWCIRAQRALGIIDAGTDAHISVVDAVDVDVDVLAAAVARAGENATLKPRRGTSGRGRVHGSRPETWPGALDRLRKLGGVVVEPWQKRVVDWSSQWRVDDDGQVHFLGTTRAVTLTSGGWVAAVVDVTADGVVAADVNDLARGAAVEGEGVEGEGVEGVEDPAGLRLHGLLRRFVDESRLLVAAAAREGYVGFCGVDAFVYAADDGALQLRMVELNARFTAGLVAVGLALRVPPGMRLRFEPARSASLMRLAS